MKRFSAFLVLSLLIGLAITANGYVASSPNYQIQSDAVSTGGTDSGSSANYNLIDTVGQFLSGSSDSTNYGNNAGYRQGSTSADSETPVCDNDGVCEDGETVANCPNDCTTTPPGGPSYQCSDGLDNDNDGLRDMADPGCSGPTDNSEYNQLVIPNVLSFNAVYNPITGNIDLTWRNPSFVNFRGVKIMRRTSPAIPNGPFDGVLIYDGPAENAVDSNVSADTDYFYMAYVYDNANPINFSSGVLASAGVPGPDEDLPPIEDPFDLFPEALTPGPGVSLRDFQFWQNGKLVKFFSDGETVYSRGSGPLTILLPYNRAPEVLKIIGMTIFEPNSKERTLSFILKVDDQKQSYSAMIGQLPEGIYPFKIHFIDYTDQSIKILSGTLRVERGVLAVMGPVGKTTSNLILGAGILAVILQLLFSGGQVRSFMDIYLLAVRGIGYLLGALGLRKKRVPWGTVYDAVTKQPLDPAYVSLLQFGTEVGSAITDIDGRYGFFVKSGNYNLTAGKTHYAFPSKVLAGKTTDEFYDSLYFGETFTTTEGQIINRNIPMDPIGFDWNEFVKSKKNFFQVHSRKLILRDRVFSGIFAAGLLLAVGEMLFIPSLLNLAILLLYVGLLLIKIFWISHHKVTAIKKAGTGEPFSFAIVKVYLPGTEQLIKKVVADDLGRFYVLVPPGDYYLTIEEKKEDQSYALVLKTEPMKLGKGVIAKDIIVP